MRIGSRVVLIAGRRDLEVRSAGIGLWSQPDRGGRRSDGGGNRRAGPGSSRPAPPGAQRSHVKVRAWTMRSHSALTTQASDRAGWPLIAARTRRTQIGTGRAWLLPSSAPERRRLVRLRSGWPAGGTAASNRARPRHPSKHPPPAPGRFTRHRHTGESARPRGEVRALTSTGESGVEAVGPSVWARQ